MNAPAKLGLYGLGLALVFGSAVAAGHAAGDVLPRSESQHSQPAHQEAEDGRRSDAGTDGTAADAPGGLQISQRGYAFTPVTTTLRPGKSTDFRFSITGPDGRPLTDYTVEHEKKLHFIVVSRDLTSFQHLHPTEAADGGWSVPLTLPRAGVYRAFADFSPAGGEGLTLGADLFASGAYQAKPLPAASRTAETDGYAVTLDGDLTPGRSSRLTLRVTKDGKPVTDLQPYLGAYGHLVALRAGDLGYLHVHPESGTAGPEIVFSAEAPSTGDYRLFLDFKHGDTVHTANFTIKAGKTAESGGDARNPSTAPAEHAH